MNKSDHLSLTEHRVKEYSRHIDKSLLEHLTLYIVLPFMREKKVYEFQMGQGYYWFFNGFGEKLRGDYVVFEELEKFIEDWSKYRLDMCRVRIVNAKNVASVEILNDHPFLVKSPDLLSNVPDVVGSNSL